MFDAVVVTVLFVAGLEAVAATHCLERCRAIGQKHVIDGVFCAKLADERWAVGVGSGRLELCVE